MDHTRQHTDEPPPHGLPAEPAPLRVGYLISRYPLPTHAFVEREIEALRELGVEIHVFGIHRAQLGTAPSAGEVEALRATFTVRPVALVPFVGAHAEALARHPRAYLRTLFLALALPGGRHGRITQLFYFGEAVPIWRECRRRRLQHVHAHFTSPSGDVALLASQLGVATGAIETWSFTAHGTDMLDDVRARLAEKIRRATFVVCVSDVGRSLLMRLVSDREWAKIEVVRCGLDARWHVAPRTREPHDGPLRVLTVGRLVPEKGHAILFDAIAELERRGVPVHVEVVGDGPRREELRRRVEELGISHRVRFAGQVGQEHIVDRYAAADVFCLASLSEGLPVVLMEAMSTGLPVIATRIMGIPELVEDGATGLIVSPGRPEEIVAALETLARSPDLRARYGAAGRERVLSEFSIERSARRLRSIFLSVVGPAHPGSGGRRGSRSRPARSGARRLREPARGSARPR
jgi:colanic acid/amylovoran biosynthesis glycosyltransferase